WCDGCSDVRVANEKSSGKLYDTVKLMGMPMTPNISQTAKQTTNAQVDTARTKMLREPGMKPPAS
ncbi:hypothetical protein, partial [Methylocystis silviterrae]|uniref:hypothetical protein n=1 Tax=Methylocystis silviterrae TaxID=2743612 RepID=UPI001AEE11DD